MTLVVNDRVQEVSTSTGSGPFVLGGGVTGYQTFSVGIGNTNSTYYTITNGTNWMDILGTYTSAANSITVDKILTSSAGGTTAVSFAAGTKNIFCTYPAATAVLAAPAAYPTVQPTLNLDFANSKTVDPRITFVRNSTATYYDGKTTAKAEENLLLQSQDFSNAVWIKSAITATAPVVTGNATTAPDGTTTASQIAYPAVTGVNAFSIVFQAPTQINTLIYTDSVYLRGSVGGEVIYLMWTPNGSTSVKTTCTLTTSWQRFTLNHTAGASINYIQLGVDLRDITQSAQVAQTIYAWGAQLEQRSSVTAYTPTTTAPITNYIPVLMTAAAGVPRLDYNPITGVALGLLIEEQRTNLFTYSQSFISHTVVLSAVSGTFVNGETVTASGGGTGEYLLDKSTATLAAIYNGTGTFTGTLTGSTSGATATCGTVTLIWTLTNSTVTAAATIAPDGTQTAFNLVSNTATGLQAIAQTVTKAASALAYTSTVHFKANQYTYSWLQISDGAGNGAIVYFNLATGAISTAVAGIGTAFTALSATTPTSVGNGWYRCNITGTSNTATSLVTQFGSSTNGTSNSVVGNGYSGVFIWGAQAE
jgi:hypothetical protein